MPVMRRDAIEKDARHLVEWRCFNVLIHNASDGSWHLSHWRVQMAAEVAGIHA
jgi:hypothetical protein